MSVTVPQRPSRLLERIAAANDEAFQLFHPAPTPIPAAIAGPIPGISAVSEPADPVNSQLRDNSSSSSSAIIELDLFL